MLEFPRGIKSQPDEDRFQDWRSATPAGVVLNLKPSGRTGQVTLHNKECRTIADADQACRRSPRNCFDSNQEFLEWASATDFNTADLNRACPQCPTRGA